MLKAIVWLYLCLSVLAIVWNVKRTRDLEVLPTVVWFFLMALPYAVQFETFPEPARTIHALGIVVIGVALLIGDSVGTGKPPIGARPHTAAWMLADYRLYVVLFAAALTLQLSLLEEIPLVEKYFRNVEDPRALAVMREGTSKLLPVNDLIKYFFTWAVSILAPLAVVLMIHRGKYFAAAVFLACALLYAAASLAKGPMYLMAAYIAALLLSEVSIRKRLYLYAALAVLAIPVAWSAGQFLLLHPESVFNYAPPPEKVAALGLPANDSRNTLTYGDRSRLRPLDSADGLSTLERSYNRYAYRVFLGPSDVSSRWYQYFPAVSGTFIGLQGLRPQERKQAGTQHPARLVGTWAYRERFPDKYLDTVQAYGSLDADAYARYGVFGVIAASILVLGIRLLLRWLPTGSRLTRTLSMLGLIQLAVLVPIASLQAMLLAHGLLVIIALMIVARHAERMANERGNGVPEACAGGAREPHAS